MQNEAADDKYYLISGPVLEKVFSWNRGWHNRTELETLELEVAQDSHLRPGDILFWTFAQCGVPSRSSGTGPAQFRGTSVASCLRGFAVVRELWFVFTRPLCCVIFPVSRQTAGSANPWTWFCEPFVEGGAGIWLHSGFFYSTKEFSPSIVVFFSLLFCGSRTTLRSLNETLTDFV